MFLALAVLSLLTETGSEFVIIIFSHTINISNDQTLILDIVGRRRRLHYVIANYGSQAIVFSHLLAKSYFGVYYYYYGQHYSF